MIRVFHIWILAYLFVVLIGCGFKGNPYYGDPKDAIDFRDLDDNSSTHFVE